MINFKDIDISDREIIEDYYNKYGYKNSESNFTNMLMWQKSYNIKYAVIDGFLVLSAYNPAIGGLYHFPIGEGNLKDVLTKLSDCCNDYFLRPLTPEMIKKTEEIMPDCYEYTHLRSSDDYVYSTQKLISLSGKKLHAKRNHYNYFINTYNYSYHRLTADMTEKCCDKVCEWIVQRSQSPEDECEAVKVIFDNFEKLNVVGGYIICEGNIAAVTVGEKFHGDALIHIEKADTDYRGIYAAINKLFLEHEFADCTYVNREEDMGIEGLRKAKLSYGPEFLIEKYTARRR